MPYEFTDLTVELPDGQHQATTRALTARWTKGPASFEARLVRHGDLAVSESVKVTQPGGVRSAYRRLPSDLDLLAAITSLGTGETALLLWLMQESIWSKELESNVERLLTEKLTVFARDLRRRTRSDRQDLVEAAARMRREGAKTTDIEAYLRTTGGVSRSTAYRIIDRSKTSHVRG